MHSQRTRALRARAIEKPILIVTESERHRRRRRHQFHRSAIANLRFEISLIAADRSGLKSTRRCLSVAARVERRPQGRD